jgi:hypothetical protein
LKTSASIVIALSVSFRSTDFCMRRARAMRRRKIIIVMPGGCTGL